MFDELEEALDRACEDEFGELFRFIPMVRAPSSRPALDATRAEFGRAGLFRNPGRLGAHSISREAMETGKGVGVQGTAPGVALRGGLPWEPKEGDHVIRDKTGQRYSIVKVERFGVDNLDLILAETRA